MDLSYFYGLTRLNSGLIKDVWRYDSSTSLGNFTINSTGNAFYRTVSGSNLEDFSLFFTYKALRNSFNSGAVTLFSNYDGVGGFMFGLDANNFPFLKTNLDAFTFDGFELGGKNTLCLQKANNAFTLSRYDVHSSGVLESQSFFASPASNFSGQAYRFAGPQSIPSGTNFFYGTVDQLLFVSEKVSPRDRLTIFSGFSDITVTPASSQNYTSFSSEWYVPPNTGLNPTGTQALLQNYFTGVYQNDVQGANLAIATEYFGKMVFTPATGGFSVINSYGFGSSGLCQTGTLIQMGDPDFVSLGEFVSSGFSVNVNFILGAADKEITPYFAASQYYTYDVSELIPGLRYSNSYELDSISYGLSAQNTGYFAGFEMYGAFAPRAETSLLGSFSGSFSNIGRVAAFDSVQGQFFGANIPSGAPVYLNGSGVTSYQFAENVIDILNYNETSADEIIYDQIKPLTPISLSNNSSPTGYYWPGTSFVATGDYSSEVMYRIKSQNYFETHPFHLFYGQAWSESSADVIFNNVDKNWT